MRKFILSIIFFVFLTQVCWADSFLSSPPKWNIGLSYSIYAWDSLRLGSASDWGGIVIRYKFSETWIGRVRGAIYTSEKNESSADKKEMKEKYYFGLGIERHFSKKRFFSPYVGGELAYGWFNFNNIDVSPYPKTGYYKTKEDRIPFDLFLGVECYLLKRISFSAEYKATFQYTKVWKDYYDKNKRWLRKEKFNLLTAGIDGSNIMLTIYF